jgi:transcriptional regulator with XRE-family HTH domain
VQTSTQSFSNQLRHVIASCGKTRYRISKETGVAESLLSKFMHGKGNISLKMLDKLAANIGLRPLKNRHDPRK